VSLTMRIMHEVGNKNTIMVHKSDIPAVYYAIIALEFKSKQFHTDPTLDTGFINVVIAMLFGTLFPEN